MTKQEKQLLLTDLCSRLPYKVRVEVDDEFMVGIHTLRGYEFGLFCVEGCHYDIDEIKPYLRPMSSMTEEEKKELFSVIESEVEDMCNRLRRGDCGIEEGKYHFNHLKELDWLNAYHFDYRGLIPLGLGIDCTGLNIYENEKSM